IEADYKSWHYILGVARTEQREGPGGALIDTFLVEMNEQGDKGQRSISRWWISPADKFAIRYDYSDGEGKGNRALVTSVSRQHRQNEIATDEHRCTQMGHPFGFPCDLCASVFICG